VHIVCVVPAGSRAKLWHSELDADEELRARNPLAVYPGADPGTVKALAADTADAVRGRFSVLCSPVSDWYAW
jgi:hypothetical protein